MWALPSATHTTYAPYDETRSRGELIGHTDAVWDLALVRDESTLISCGAEGTVKVWDVSGPSGGGSLKLTWAWNGLENPDELNEDMDAPGATAVEALKADLKKVAVAYQNAVVKIFDIESGKELSRLQSDLSYGASFGLARMTEFRTLCKMARQGRKSIGSPPTLPCPYWSPRTRTSLFGYLMF